jgi:hypothetical protein
MPRRGVMNGFENPYVVELVVVTDGLDAELSRRIIQFHKSRDIQPRHGRRITNSRANSVIVGAFPIYRSLAPLLNSWAEFYKPSE